MVKHVQRGQRAWYAWMRPLYRRAMAATNADQSATFLGGEPRPGPYTEGSEGLEEAQAGVWPSVKSTWQVERANMQAQ